MRLEQDEERTSEESNEDAYGGSKEKGEESKEGKEDENGNEMELLEDQSGYERMGEHGGGRNARGKGSGKP